MVTEFVSRTGAGSKLVSKWEGGKGEGRKGKGRWEGGGRGRREGRGEGEGGERTHKDQGMAIWSFYLHIVTNCVRNVVNCLHAIHVGWISNCSSPPQSRWSI